MAAFVLRRFASLAVVLFCVITITFLLVRLAPGGPFARERKIPEAIEKQLLARYKLDGSAGRARATSWAERLGCADATAARVGDFGAMLDQYFSYMGDLLHGDLRLSTKFRDRSVNELIGQSLPVSLQVGFTAFLLATLGGVWLGSLAAVRHRTWVDATAMLGALFAISIPAFVTGPVLVLVFALWLRWLPVGGWTSWQSLILPALTLAGPYVAYIARLMRSSLLEVLHQDFVRTARAKGLGGGAVLYKHALKVAILPVVSFLGPLAANLLTGSIVIEAIFAIPGAGSFFVNSIINRDVFLLCGIIIVYCALLVVLNLAVDIAYTFLDRRIQLHD